MAFLTLAEVYKTQVAPNTAHSGVALPMNGIFSVMPFRPASHGNQDKFRLFSADSSAAIINSDGEITPDTSSTTVKTIDLAITQASLTAQSSFAESWASKNGLSPVLSYFNDNSASKYGSIRNTLASEFFYGTTVFDGFLKVAKAESTNTPVGATKGTDIFFVRFDEANSFGLYNEGVMLEDGIVKFELLPKQMITGTNGGLVESYVGNYTSVLGVRAIPGYVSVLEGISDVKKPTIGQIKNALMQAGSYKEGQTFIFCSAKGKGILSDVLGDSLKSTLLNAGEAYTNVDYFDGHRVVIDDSIKNERTV